MVFFLLPNVPQLFVVTMGAIACGISCGANWMLKGDHTLELPPSSWRDLLSGRSTRGGTVRIEDVLPGGGSPVAILVRGEG